MGSLLTCSVYYPYQQRVFVVIFGCFSFLAFVTFTSMLAANLSCIHLVQMYRIRLVMEDAKMHFDCENGLRCKGYSGDWFHKINSYYRTIYCQPQKVLSLRVCAHCLVHVHAVVYGQWPQKAFRHLKLNEFHCISYSIKLSGRSTVQASFKWLTIDILFTLWL